MADEMKPHEVNAFLDHMRLARCKHCGGTGYRLDDKAIGWALRERREKQELSAREIARRLNVTPAYVSDLENGRRGWNYDRVERYLKAAGLLKTK